MDDVMRGEMDKIAFNIGNIFQYTRMLLKHIDGEKENERGEGEEGHA